MIIPVAYHLISYLRTMIFVLLNHVYMQTGGYFCSLGPHFEKTIKMFTYDDQTSHGVSTTPVLRVCTCHVIQK